MLRCAVGCLAITESSSSCNFILREIRLKKSRRSARRVFEVCPRLSKMSWEILRFLSETMGKPDRVPTPGLVVISTLCLTLLRLFRDSVRADEFLPVVKTGNCLRNLVPLFHTSSQILLAFQTALGDGPECRFNTLVRAKDV